MAFFLRNPLQGAGLSKMLTGHFSVRSNNFFYKNRCSGARRGGYLRFQSDFLLKVT